MIKTGGPKNEAHKELWAAIIEKAIAEVHKGYGHLDKGDPELAYGLLLGTTTDQMNRYVLNDSGIEDLITFAAGLDSDSKPNKISLLQAFDAPKEKYSITLRSKSFAAIKSIYDSWVAYNNDSTMIADKKR